MKEEAPNQETKRAIKYLKLSELSQEVIDDIAKEFLEIAGGHNTGGNLQLDNIKNFLDKKGRASFRWGSSKLSNPHSKFSVSTVSVLENGDKLIKFFLSLIWAAIKQMPKPPRKFRLNFKKKSKNTSTPKILACKYE